MLKGSHNRVILCFIFGRDSEFHSHCSHFPPFDLPQGCAAEAVSLSAAPMEQQPCRLHPPCSPKLGISSLFLGQGNGPAGRHEVKSVIIT